MKIKKGDNVMVIAGKDKGKTGTVVRVLPREERVVVEGINTAKRHLKPRMGNPGGIIDVDRPIHISNVMVIDPETNQRTRVGYQQDKEGKKTRITKKSETTLS